MGGEEGCWGGGAGGWVVGGGLWGWVAQCSGVGLGVRSQRGLLNNPEVQPGVTSRQLSQFLPYKSIFVLY